MLLVLAGLIAAFVAYQLWGTGLVQSGQQHRLLHQFEQTLASHRAASRRIPPDHAAAGPSVDRGAAGPPAAGGAEPPPSIGQPVARMRIPAIGLDQVVVEGTGSAQLAVGPGHYPGTAPLGTRGNAAVAGHRTTHGRPFYDLNLLAVGDPIVVTTVRGTFVYRVATSEVVAPADVAVLAPSPVAELTLTTCTPRYSAAQRLVVVARMAVRTVPAPSPATAAPTRVAGAAGTDPVDQVGAWVALAAWGLACVALVLVTRYLRRRASRRGWLAPAVAALPALVLLFFLFGALDSLLPPSL